MNRKIFTSFVSILLVLCTVFTTACRGGGGSVETMNYNDRPAYLKGVHEFNKIDTNKKFIYNKKSDYVIVVPDEISQIISSASTELCLLLAEGAGVEMVVYKESQRPLNAKYISLGDTVVSTQAGVATDSRINSNGYVIKTVSDNIYIKSKADQGVLWGVYEFLTQTIGYNPVANDEWTFNSDNTSVPLYDFDIVDSPDVERRIANNGIIAHDKEGANKYRFLLAHKDVYISGNGINAFHNYFQYVPKATYEVGHPLWYSNCGTQLCLTAHGNQTEYEGLVSVVAEGMKKLIAAEKDNRTVLTFTQEDKFTWCNCPSCAELTSKYGTDAGTAIMFINDVVEQVEPWREVNYPEKEILYTIFAYMKTVGAPAQKNSKGEYEPIDSNVVCNPKVAVLFAPIYDSLALSIEAPQNAGLYENIMAWKSVSSNFGYWGYTTYYEDNDGIIMFNSFTTAKSIYNFLLSELNVKWVYDQGQGSMSHTGFTMFKMYLNSQWQWDVNRDYRELKENFFKTYFRDAADIMMKFYDEYAMHMWNIYTQYKQGMGVYSGCKNQKYFPYKVLEQWNNYCEEAYKTIEKYKDTNPTLYKKLYERIDIESFSPRHLMVTWYRGNFSETEWNDFYAEYSRDDDYYGLNGIGGAVD